MKNRIACCVAALALCGAPAASAQGGAARGSAAASSVSDTSMSPARQHARARATMDSLRRVALRYATYAGFADTSCAPGDIRTFERDTAGVARKALLTLEKLVLAYGAAVSLDNPLGKALLRAVLRLEGGGPGPRWDTMTGLGPRAFNPILPVELFNPETKKCQMTPGIEPDGIVLPDVTGLVVPRDSGALNVTVGYGTTGLTELRNFFFSRHAADSQAVLHYTRVNAHAMWENYAIIGVVREKQLKGAVPIPNETTGAVYAFHRVGAEWRVLAMIRNW
jgi:hypothetical protein